MTTSELDDANDEFWTPERVDVGERDNRLNCWQ